MSVHWPVIRSLIARPMRQRVVDDRRGYRGIDIVVAAAHLAAHLAPRCRSKTLGVLLPTSGAFPIAALAGWWLGKTVVPLNYLLKPEELQFVIDDCGCDTVVSVRPMLEFLKTTPRVKDLVLMEDVSFRGLPDVGWPARPSPEQLAVLLYTSGTSGRPKGVMLTHHNLRSNVRQVTSWVDFRRDDVLLGVLPQFHSFGFTVLTLVPLTVGCRVVYAARFVPQQIIRLLREHRPTVFIAIPSMYGALLHAKDAAPDDFASLKLAVSGGEPLPAAVTEQFRERFGVTISEGYGLTETAPVTNWCRPHEYRPHSVGPPLPAIDQRIVDLESGADLPPGREGEIRMTGPNVMRGYYHRPEETAAAFDERGYFRTGDIGRKDEQGHLYITGRLKEMIIIGGENVFPREIEEVLEAHPAVGAAGVVGNHDPIRGEVPIAFVEPADGADIHPGEVLRWCRDRLAGYKVPRELRIVESLPRGPTGKVLRRELKKQL